MLKVPVKKLEALEASRFDLLPDIVFVRALASSVCRTLKIDSAPIMERLPHTEAPQLLLRGTATSAPFRSSGDGQRSSVWSLLTKPAGAAVVLLLVASLIVAFLPGLTTQFRQIGALIDSRTATASGSTNTASPESANASVDLKIEKAVTGAPDLPPGGPAGSAAPSATQPGDVLTNGTPLEGSAPVAGVVAIGDSWVEVTDAKKQTVLRRTLIAGESVGVSGTLPLSAKVGRANMTEVNVGGQAFDLAPWSKDNVARFEVK
jgi:cytoskeleton protein RodZ